MSYLFAGYFVRIFDDVCKAPRTVPKTADIQSVIWLCFDDFVIGYLI